MAVFFASELEAVATFWRIYRKDGVTLGFTSHDRDLYFGNILHRAAPGMQPSAIRRTSDFSLDSAEVEGALSHDAITEADLAAGAFDAARIEIGAVNWETLEHELIYSGTLGEVQRAQLEDRRARSRLGTECQGQHPASRRSLVDCRLGMERPGY